MKAVVNISVFAQTQSNLQQAQELSILAGNTCGRCVLMSRVSAFRRYLLKMMNKFVAIDPEWSRACLQNKR